LDPRVEGLASVASIVTINVIGGFVQIVDSPARQAFISRLVTRRISPAPSA
jgi:hypothetical protein